MSRRSRTSPIILTDLLRGFPFNYLYLLLRQAIEVIDEAVNLAVRGVDLALKADLVIHIFRNSAASSPLYLAQEPR